MTIEAMDEAEASSSTGPHRMRITSGGQVGGYVNFALSFLKENPDRSLVLHTLPSTSQPESSESSCSKTSISTLNPSLLATPKLISVTEKIKREYMAYISASESGKGKNKAVGIWQYTESGLLPSTGPELGLEDVLEGRNKPKMIHRPYLQITLGTKPLGLEVGTKGRNVTCQYVMVRRRKSKSKLESDKEKDDGAKKSVSESDVLPGADATGGQADVGAVKGIEKKAKAIKRKAGNSQSSEATRGGKKRKK